MISTTTLITFLAGLVVGLAIGSAKFRAGLAGFLFGRRGTIAGDYRQPRRRTALPRKPTSDREGLQLVKCPNCQGIGRVPRELPPLMRGTPGVVPWEVCPDCEGTGTIYEKKEQKGA